MSGWAIRSSITPGIGGAISGRSARSDPVNAATTPGACRAALTSTDRIRACAIGDRTKNTWQAPASRSSTTSSV
jgi:hypothetical protein